MSRISSFGANQNMVNFMLRAQQQMDATNTQVATKQVSQNYAGLSSKAQLLLGFENKTTILERYRDNNTTADFRLETSTITLGSLQSTISDMRSILKDFEIDSPDETSVGYIQDWAFRTLVDIESFLNTEADGRYLYSGSKVTTRPVNLGLTNLADFQSLYDGSRVTYPTTRDAHLSSFSLTQDENNLTSGAFINANNWLTFYQDNDGDLFSSGSGTIEAPSSMFGNLSAGSVFTVSGTTGGTNDGTYTVASVTNGIITINTTMLTDESAIDQFTNESLLAPHGATITVGNGAVLATADTGDLTIDGTAATLTAATVGAFAGISVGDHIQLAGSASNNGTYEVTGVAGDVLTLGTNTGVTVTLPNETSLAYADTGNLTFDRSANTITAATPGAFNDAVIGQTITIAGSGQNNGTYTVTANDGTTLTIEPQKLTNQGTVSGSTLYNYPAGGQLSFDATNRTITSQDYSGAAISNAFSDYQVGDSITVAGTTVAPTLYTQVDFTSVGLDQDTIQIQDGGGGAVRGAFNGVQIGDTITVAGATAGANDQAYVVNFVSADGSTITVDGNIGAAATDTASIAVTGANMTNLTTQMDLQFTDNGATDRITLQDDTATGVANAFDNMTAGMTVTIANSTSNNGTYLITNVDAAGGFIDVTAIDGSDPGLTTEASVAATTITASGNDGTYTISAISSDGSAVTVETGTPLIANQTDTDGATLSSATRSLSHTAGSRLLINDAAETIQIVNAGDGTAITEAVQGLTAGMIIEINGSANNDGFYSIASVDSATGTITLDASTPITGGNENYMPSAAAGSTGTLRVYGTPGTLAANSDYYAGDEVSVEHRVEEERELATGITAIDPTFERVIRALGMIAQGQFGTAGGLDQNVSRITDAIYLLDLSLGDERTTPPPFGAEESGDVIALQQTTAFNRLIVQRTIEQQGTTIDFLLGQSAAVETADPLETITKLLSQQTSLEASYQAISRVRTLSLSNFL